MTSRAILLAAVALLAIAPRLDAQQPPANYEQTAASAAAYEGQSHAQYGFNADAPETREAFTEIAQFFDRHLGR